MITKGGKVSPEGLLVAFKLGILFWFSTDDEFSKSMLLFSVFELFVWLSNNFGSVFEISEPIIS